jgi:hypothetical protein
MPKGWGVFQEGEEMHVIPLKDTMDHSTSANCWCLPFQADPEERPWIYAHNSLDGREDDERRADAGA